jgi:hypothetical protein
MNPTILRPSRAQRGILFGFLSVLLLAALIRGAFGVGRASTSIVTGLAAVLLVAVLLAWRRLSRRPASLEIGSEVIRFVDPLARVPERQLTRSGGDLEVGVRMLSARTWVPYLSQRALEPVDLHYFNPRQVAQACRDHGWPVTERPPGRGGRG